MSHNGGTSHLEVDEAARRYINLVNLDTSNLKIVVAGRASE
jgi:hypothetical protein